MGRVTNEGGDAATEEEGGRQRMAAIGERGDTRIALVTLLPRNFRAMAVVCSLRKQ